MANFPDMFRRGGQPRSSRGEVSELQRQIDRIFDDFFTAPGWVSEFDQSSRAFSPSCDIEETDKEYRLSFDLPGIPKENINIELRGDELVVSGERKEEKEEKGKTTYRKERSYGSFRRSFTLPSSTKMDQVRADYSDGVLNILIPKAEEKKAQRIEVGGSTSGTKGSGRAA